MPAVPGYKDQQFRLAREASYGVAPAGGWRRTGSLTLDLQPKIDTDQFTASGDAVPSLSVLNDDSADGSLKGKADYEFTQYPMSSFFGDATISVPGGGTVSRQWDWAWNGTDTILPASFAVQVGTPAVAEQALGAIFSGWTLKGGRKGMDLTAKLFAKKVTQGAALGGATSEVQTVTVTGAPTGGTLTLSYKGATTATIAYNASAAAVQAALEALPTVQAGQVVAAGGPLPATPVTVTFAGLFAGRDVPAMTAANAFTGGTSPAVAVTTTTPGADAATNIAPKPMGPLDFTLYMDSTWAGLGTTKLTQSFEMSLDWGDKFERTRPINAALDSDGYVEKTDQKHQLDLTMAVDAKEAALLAAVRAGQTQFFRVEAVGPVIEGAIPYRFRQDVAAFITDADRGQNMGSVYVRKIGLRIGRDLVSGNCAATRLVNTQQSL